MLWQVITDTQLRVLERQILALQDYNIKSKRGKLWIGDAKDGKKRKQRRILVPPDPEAEKTGQNLQTENPKSNHSQISVKIGPSQRKRKKHKAKDSQNEEAWPIKSCTSESDMDFDEPDMNTTAVEARPPRPKRMSTRRKNATRLQHDENDTISLEDSTLISSVGKTSKPKGYMMRELKSVSYSWALEPCGVCGNPAWQIGNEMVMCDGPGCDCIVHLGCYGLANEPTEEVWYCDSCLAGLDPHKANCALCPVTGGVLRRIDNMGKWRVPPSLQRNPHAHICCVLWHKSVFFLEGATLQNIDLSKLTQKQASLKCQICEQTGNGCSQCSFRNCSNTFHVLCARSREHKCALGHDGSTLVFCSDHSFDDRFAAEVSKMMEGTVASLDPDDVNLALRSEQNRQDHGTIVDLTNLSPETEPMSERH